MALNYTTLKALVLSDSHRSDLTTEVTDFVRRAEGLIRRELRAHETRLTLDESDRSAEGVYTLPDTIQEVRAAYAPNGSDSYVLENVGLHGIRMISADSNVLFYAVSGSTVEFRGVPATDFEIELVGMGWPVSLETTPTNDLLTNHEELYIAASQFYLYKHTQDLELAQGALDSFGDTIRKLNKLIGRKIGGGSVLPAYNFGHISTGSGY